MKEILQKVYKLLRAKTGLRSLYQYGEFGIYLPSDHLLPIYQKRHQNYDRFLPLLAQCIKEGETIVDIGANVGDTLASIIEKNSKPNFICIEADDVFFNLLEKNTRIIKEHYKEANIYLFKNLIGQKVSGVNLEGSGGTKRANISVTGRLESIKLDVLLSNFEHGEIKLLKIDVDGFDWDVIESASEILRHAGPLLFFELSFETSYQYKGFLECLETLEKFDYRDWTIFDNFGGLMTRTNDKQILVQLMEYLKNQNLRGTTRTLYYFDVLVARELDSEFVSIALSEYAKVISQRQSLEFSE